MIPDADHIGKIQSSVEQKILQSAEPVSEFALIKEVEHQGLFDDILGEVPALALFRKHFLVMHVLYRLQMIYLEQGKLLQVNALAVRFVDEHRGQDDRAIASPLDIALRRYYLDLDELEEVAEVEVIGMLNGFWRRYESWKSADDAYDVLGLSQNAEWREVQSAFRRAAATAHPDKGGDPNRFRRIFEAYQALKLKLK